MSYLPLPKASKNPQTPIEQQRQLLGWWHWVILILLGPFTTWLVKRHLEHIHNVGLPTYIRVFLAILSLPWIYIGYILMQEVRKDTDIWTFLLVAGIYQWLTSIAALELWVYVIAGGEAMIKAWANRETHAEQQRRLLEEAHSKSNKRIEQQLRTTPDTPANVLPLGAWLETVQEDTSREKKLFLTRNNWVGLHKSATKTSILILAEPGAGKTTLLKQYTYSLLEHTDHDIIWIDGKGNQQLAVEIPAMMHAKNRGPVPVFMFGYANNPSIYNPFVGDRKAILNRLAAMLDLEKTGGPEDYYKGEQFGILQFVCGDTDPVGNFDAPRSFGQVLERLSPNKLTDLYKEGEKKLSKLDSTVQELVRDIDNTDLKMFRDLRNKVRRWSSDFGSTTGEDGFALGDHRCSYFSIRTMGYGVSSKDAMRMIVNDAIHYVGNRMNGRPTDIIVDEGGALGPTTLIEISRQGREFGAGVALATQSDSSLGTSAQQREIFVTYTTKILMRYPFPEVLASLAGTKVEGDVSGSWENGEPTGRSTVKEVHKLKVDLNRAISLDDGEAYIMRSGYGYLMKVPEKPREEPFVPVPPKAYTRKPVISKPSKQQQEPQGMAGVAR